MLNFYIAAKQHSQKKLPLDFKNLKDLVAIYQSQEKQSLHWRQLHGLQDSFRMSLKKMKLHVSMMSGKALQAKPIPSNCYETGKFSLMLLFSFF